LIKLRLKGQRQLTVLLLLAYDANGENYYDSHLHSGKYLGDFNQTGPWVYNVNEEFIIKPGSGLIVQLRLANSVEISDESASIFCPMVCTFGLDTDQSFVPMEDMRNALNTIFKSPDDRISATWVYQDMLGLAYGNDYSIIDMRTGKELTRGAYSDATGFWQNAPGVKIGDAEHHPSSECYGITAGWIYGDLIGFTAKNAFWHSLMSNFHKEEVWDEDGSGSGNLQSHPFWNVPQLASLFEGGVTAGFKTPLGFHVVFSKDKIYVLSNETNEWIIGKPYRDLQPGEPFSFLADIAKQGILPEVNAAFYNAGSKEFVFMHGQTWHSYTIFGDNAGTWNHGNLGSSTSGVFKTAYKKPLKNTPIYRDLKIVNGKYENSSLDGAPNGRQKGARTATSKPDSPDFQEVRNRYDMVGPDYTGAQKGISASMVDKDDRRVYNANINSCKLPVGLAAVNDYDKHVSIYPIFNMTFGEFQEKLNEVEWQ